MVQNIVEKIKKHLRNLQAENNPKFKKRAGWPKNLVSYEKKKTSLQSYKRHEGFDSLYLDTCFVHFAFGVASLLGVTGKSLDERERHENVMIAVYAIK